MTYHPTCAGPHEAYLHGTQAITSSTAASLALQLRPSFRTDSLEAILVGGFHPYAGVPSVPIQPLTVDLFARAIDCHLLLEDPADLVFTCHATRGPDHG